jgi:hypothetical protein
MNTDQLLRQQLVNMLVIEQAHMSFESAVKDFPVEHINTRPPSVPYTFWHLLDHIRFCQWDILDYIRNPHYQAVEWPRDYWQPRDATTDLNGWNKTIQDFLRDRDELVNMVQNPQHDLTVKIPHGWEDDHSILREVLVVASHNSYHIGEFGILRQVMGLWT